MASTSNPFDPPDLDDDRGIRRLIANLKKATADFESAHNDAQSSDDIDVRRVANSLRNEMISLYDELLLHQPMQSNASLCSSRTEALRSATAIIARCPSLTEEPLSGSCMSPPLASTMSEPHAFDSRAAHSSSAPSQYPLTQLIGQLQTSCLSYEIATDPVFEENPEHVNAMRNSLIYNRQRLEERLVGDIPSSSASAAVRRASLLLGEDVDNRPAPSTTANSFQAPNPAHSLFPPQSGEPSMMMNARANERDRSSHRRDGLDSMSLANSSERYADLHAQLLSERRVFDDRLQSERRRQDDEIREERRRHEREMDAMRASERRRFDDELARVRNDANNRISRRGFSSMSLTDANRNNNRSNAQPVTQSDPRAPAFLRTTTRDPLPMDIDYPTSVMAPPPVVQAPVLRAPAFTPVYSNPTPVATATLASAASLASSANLTAPVASAVNHTAAPVNPAATVATVPIVSTDFSTAAPVAPAVASNPLLDVQTQAHAFAMLMQRRPKVKFSGENKKMDFESFIHRFETMTAVPGSTDVMRLAELSHWFTGNAALICDRFVSELDATKGLALALKALRKEFGRRVLTAKQMLQEILAGDRLSEKDFTGLKTFALKLEKAYQIAIDTRRQGTFDLPETINDVLRLKLPHLAVNWAKKVSAAEATFLEGDEMHEFTFKEFLSFVKKQIVIAETTSEILTNPDTQKSTSKPTVRIAAADTSKPSGSQSAPPQTNKPKPPNGDKSEGQSRCAVCPKSMHHTSDCRKFAGLAAAERARVVKTKGLCIRCLGARHLLKDCTSTMTCKECNSPHHSAMHGVALFPKASGKGDAPPS